MQVVNLYSALIATHAASMNMEVGEVIHKWTTYIKL